MKMILVAFALCSLCAATDWVELTSPTPYAISDIQFLDAHVGWLTDIDGGVWYTLNGGNNWTDRSIGDQIRLEEIHMLDPDTGYVVSEGGVLFGTTDRGVSWDTLYSADIRLKSLYFISTTEGWFGGEDPYPYIDQAVIFHYNNGSIMQESIDSIPGEIRKIQIIETDGATPVGYFVAQENTIHAGVYRRAGSLWRKCPASSCNVSIFFTDYSTGIATSSHGLIEKTENYGRSFYEVYQTAVPFTLNDVELVDNYGWAVGNDHYAVYSTSDGGDSWTVDSLPGFTYQLSSVSCVYHPINNSYYVWIAGANGTLLRGLIAPYEFDAGSTAESGILDLALYGGSCSSERVVHFEMLREATVDITVYDIAGRALVENRLGNLSAGTYDVSLQDMLDNGSSLASGVYLAVVSNGNDILGSLSFVVAD